MAPIHSWFTAGRRLLLAVGRLLRITQAHIALNTWLHCVLCLVLTITLANAQFWPASCQVTSEIHPCAVSMLGHSSGTVGVVAGGAVLRHGGGGGARRARYALHICALPCVVTLRSRPMRCPCFFAFRRLLNEVIGFAFSSAAFSAKTLALHRPFCPPFTATI